MPTIHLIERANNFHKIDEGSRLWESRAWHITEQVAKSLIGGDVYFHRYQDKPSFFGGKIVNYRVENEGPDKGRINLHFIFSPEYRSVRTSKDGWGYEKKITI